MKKWICLIPYLLVLVGSVQANEMLHKRAVEAQILEGNFEKAEQIAIEELQKPRDWLNQVATDVTSYYLKKYILEGPEILADKAQKVAQYFKLDVFQIRDKVYTLALMEMTPERLQEVEGQLNSTWLLDAFDEVLKGSVTPRVLQKEFRKLEILEIPFTDERVKIALTSFVKREVSLQMDIIRSKQKQNEDLRTKRSSKIISTWKKQFRFELSSEQVHAIAPTLQNLSYIQLRVPELRSWMKEGVQRQVLDIASVVYRAKDLDLD